MHCLQDLLSEIFDSLFLLFDGCVMASEPLPQCGDFRCFQPQMVGEPGAGGHD
jgi:hypothetical protein